MLQRRSGEEGERVYYFKALVMVEKILASVLQANPFTRGGRGLVKGMACKTNKILVLSQTFHGTIAYKRTSMRLSYASYSTVRCILYRTYDDCFAVIFNY